MALRLLPVAPRQGLVWIRQGFATWRKRPLALIGMFSFFLVSMLMMMVIVPVLGGPLGLALLPMLSLGFMIASRSLSGGGPVHALQLVEGLRHPVPRQRHAQWALCGAYALASLAVISLSDWADSGLFDDLQRLLPQAGNDPKAAAQVTAILGDERLAMGMLIRVGLAGLLSTPFWHAPALVHWGGQGAMQALFTSTLAIWRTRGAFTVYLLGWGALMLGAALLVTLLVLATGARQALGLLTMPIGLVFSAAFYTSLWFSFSDTFGEPEVTIAP